MMKQSFTIVDPIGFHARPATVVVNAAVKLPCRIHCEYRGYDVDMKSLMGIMALGMPYNAVFTLSCDGKDEEKAMQLMTDILISQKIISGPTQQN